MSTKIEIELSEVERMRNHIHEIETKLYDANVKLKELDEDELKRRAVRLSRHLADQYIKLVFRKLGFDDSMIETGLKYEDGLISLIGKDWFTKDDKVHFTIGAQITNKFRTAFISLGVETKKQEDKSDYDYPL